jgi:hypothetical protein
MSSGIGWRPALAAETPTHRDRYHPYVTVMRFRRAGPYQCNEPADKCPTQEEVEQEYRSGISLMAGNNRRQEVQQDHENQGQHRAPLSRTSRRGRHSARF